jgi:hypothetical protein
VLCAAGEVLPSSLWGSVHRLAVMAEGAGIAQDHLVYIPTRDHKAETDTGTLSFFSNKTSLFEVAQALN